MGAVPKEKKLPTLLSIRDTISEDAIAVRRWGEIKDYFYLDDANDKDRIRALLRDSDVRAAIMITLESWIQQEKQNRGLADLVKILRSRNLNALSDKLEAIYQPGDILLQGTVSPSAPANPTNSTAPIQQFQVRKSEVDISRNITGEDWVVSLLRIPDCKHNQHAFITVEGIVDNKAKIWFMDLISKSGQYGMGNHPGEIRVDEYSAQMIAYGQTATPLVYSRQNKSDHNMMNPKPGRKTLAKSWNVPADKALALVERITEGKNDPPKFVITGKNSLLEYLRPGVEGHNCYTWAIAQLLDLDDKAIREAFEELQRDYGAFIMEDFLARTNLAWFTSQFLRNAVKSESRSSMGLRVVGAIVLVGACAILFQYYFIERWCWKCEEQTSVIPEPLFAKEVIMGHLPIVKEEPKLIDIRDVIASEPVALGDWSTIADYLVADPAKILQIRGLLREHEYKRAIQLTLEVWIQEKAQHTLTDLVKVLRRQRMGALSDNLEAKFEPLTIRL